MYMYNAIFDSLRLADVVELQLIVLVKLYILDGYQTITLHMSSFGVVTRIMLEGSSYYIFSHHDD